MLWVARVTRFTTAVSAQYRIDGRRWSSGWTGSWLDEYGAGGGKGAFHLFFPSRQLVAAQASLARQDLTEIWQSRKAGLGRVEMNEGDLALEVVLERDSK